MFPQPEWNQGKGLQKLHARHPLRRSKPLYESVALLLFQGTLASSTEKRSTYKVVPGEGAGGGGFPESYFTLLI